VILSIRKNQLHELERGPYHEVSTSTATPRRGCVPLFALRALFGAGGIWRCNSPDFGHCKGSHRRRGARRAGNGRRNANRHQADNAHRYAGFLFFSVASVGHYDLEVCANGFKEYKQTGMILDVSMVLLVDVPLELGSSGQEVTITAAGVQVETTSTQMGEVISDTPASHRVPLVQQGSRRKTAFGPFFSRPARRRLESVLSGESGIPKS
jgi:hypothetical protein